MDSRLRHVDVEFMDPYSLELMASGVGLGGPELEVFRFPELVEGTIYTPSFWGFSIHGFLLIFIFKLIHDGLFGSISRPKCYPSMTDVAEAEVLP